MKMNKWFIIPFLVTLFLIFQKRIFEKIWIFKNQNKTFYGTIIGEKTRLYYHQDEKFGIVSDIFEKVKEDYDIDIETATEGGRGDFIAASAIPIDGPEETSLYTDFYLNINLILFTRKELSSFTELKGKRIISRGITDKFIKTLEVTEDKHITSPEEIVLEYERGGYDAMLLDEEALRNPIVEEEIKDMHRILLPEKYDIKVRMEIPEGNRYLFNILNRTIKDLRYSGELEDIILDNTAKLEKKNINFTPEEVEWLKNKKILKAKVDRDITLLSKPGTFGYKNGPISFYAQGFSQLMGIPIIASEEEFDFTLDAEDYLREGFIYTDPVYLYNIAAFSKNIKTISSMTSLHGLKVGVLKGTIEEEYLRKNLHLGEISTYDTFMELAGSLKKDRIDYFLMRDDLATFLLQSTDLTTIHRAGILKKVTKTLGVPKDNKILYSILTKVMVMKRESIDIEIIKRQVENSPVFFQVKLKTIALWAGIISLILIYLIFLIFQMNEKNRYLNERKKELEKNHTLILAIVNVLEKSNEYNDEDTGEHIKRVGLYSELLGELAGFSKKFTTDIRNFASLHDVGKVGIDDSILKKKGKLSEEEFQRMKEHVHIGYELIKESKLGVMAENIVLYHHERWSGGGYMSGLEGEDIPIEARIISLSDVYDALRQKRSYKPAFSHEKSLTTIKEERGRQFDPVLVDLFIENHKMFEEIYRNNH